MRLSKTKNVNLTTHHASKIAILLIFLIAVLFVAIHLHAQSKGIIEPVKLPNPTTPKATQGMKMVADVLDAVGGKSEAGSVKMQISSGGQPSAIGKSEDTGYKLFAGYIYPTEVPQPPIIIAHFMTPEGEPYPFDVTISDGEWVQAFDSVTYCSTAVPETATYWLTYNRNEGEMLYDVELGFLPGEIREFDFYAWEPETLVTDMRTRPRILFQERGANPSLSWNWVPDSLILYWSLTCDSNRYVGVSIGIDDDISESPTYALLQCLPYPHPFPHHFPHGECVAGMNCVVTAQNSQNCQMVFEEIDPGWPIISERSKRERVEELHSNLIGIDSSVYPPQYLIPQYAVPPGHYILKQEAEEPMPYVPLSLPMDLEGVKGLGSVIAYISNPKIAELEPFTFSVCAENPFAYSSYSNLLHFPGDSITVEINTLTEYDWWGAFVLPESLTVDSLFAYGDDTVEVIMFDRYDFTINHIEGSDLLLVVVRNQYYYDHLKLKYGPRGDVTGDGVANIADVVYLINYLFIGGSAPNPLDKGDVNCDGAVNIADVVYLLNYLFAGGPPPCGG